MASPPPSDLRRLVLAIDLHPLLSLPSPSSYTSPLLAAARLLLPSSPLSSHMPFVSSLTPLLSSSALRRLLPYPFDLPSSTLSSLSRTLQDPVLELPHASPRSPRAPLIAQSLFQLACDCPWDDDDDGGGGGKNLLLVLSPLPRTPEGVDEFVGAGKVGALLERAFAAVNARLGRAKVRVCWVDVNFDGGRGMREVVEGIMGMGWGVTSTDEVALGLKVVPFGMMYPRILSRSVGVEALGTERKGRAELILEISDVSGQPLECKCCALEVFDKMPEREQLSCLWGQLSGGADVSILVKGVGKVDEVEGTMGDLRGVVMLCGTFVNCDKKKRKWALEDGFFGDKVIEVLCGERGNFAPENPVWQLILIFLYRRNLCALVSMAWDGDNKSLVGVIKPFTVNSAMLSIFDARKEGGGLTATGATYVSGASCSKDADKSSKLEKRKLHKLCNLSWCDFLELVFRETDGDSQNIDLEDVYLVKDFKNSKKMRFLQCWMKQIKRTIASPPIKLYGNNMLMQDTREGTEDGIVGSQQERETPFSSSPAREADISQSVNEEHLLPTPVDLLPTPVEDLETFPGSLPGKIEYGLSSEAVDLGDLAVRLVELATRASYMSFQRTLEETQGIESTSTDASYDLNVVSEVSTLLLRKPRDVAAKYKSPTPSAPTTNSITSVCSANRKIREHELQILFRMEILRSSIGLSIDENMKAKMVKDICSLLENIEFDLQGGTFSGESLIDFVERTIKTRYAISLGDVIHKIYSRMEFLAFDGGDEEDSVSAPNCNHNDENQDKLGGYTSRDATARENDKISIQDVKPLLAKTLSGNNIEQNYKANKMDHRVKKASEKRERARRFSHFTSWAQNLQRVWAPQLNKMERSLHGYHTNVVEKRNIVERRRKPSHNEMVLETPMIGKKHRFQETNSAQEDAECDSCSSRLISKALFLDEVDS